MQATLFLADGTLVHGRGLGANQEMMGEVVFNTAMSGYEEVISDPSYLGQIVLFTSSHIGNTGINFDDHESSQMYAEGMICKNISLHPDNHRSLISLENYLKEQNKCALYDVDTRFLTQILRDKGCLLGILSTYDHDKNSLTQKLMQFKNLDQNHPISMYKGNQKHFSKQTKSNNQKIRIAVIDCGTKQGILNALESLDCEPVLFSWSVSAQEIKLSQVDGVLFSNGPGDPSDFAKRTSIIALMQQLLALYPCFGICLGHQLIGLALGAKIKKLKFGHHAINHPVKSLDSKESSVLVTSQNHNYIVDISGLEDIFEATHIHLNDGTLAGMRHKTLPIFSVQFHPESNPGPRDAQIIFQHFITAIKENKKDWNAKKR